MTTSAIHRFHIPVMGLAYTIDTPIKVARFGISSVISIIEDNLIEKLRSYYSHYINEKYVPIAPSETDYRAKRITSYLNLVNRIVNEQVENLRAGAFESGSEITKYFEMLPDGSDLRKIYELMATLSDPEDRQQLENWLRLQIEPGSIDVNIMTKLDKNNNDRQGNMVEDGSDAVAALRGYVNSELVNSSIILSAGMNPRLFSYMEKLDSFEANQQGVFKKKIVIKVSDYRSALIQGKMLAKKGLWVSEFRIESGLNCGGHAFATEGYLIGPILEEFKSKKEDLVRDLFEIYNQALTAKGKAGFDKAHEIKITMQGGIGTHQEDEFLHHYYGIDSTGWGTPFLLVPEATNVDEDTLQLLSKATEKDIVLSKYSPLGIRFHYLKGSTAEKEKLDRIGKGAPGSPCTEKYLVSNTEFGPEPLCTASRVYQKKKIEQLKSLNLKEDEYDVRLREVLDKECLCIGLSNAVIKSYKLQSFKHLNGVNICPGPNIAYFSEIVSLQKMIDHIYGRVNILTNRNRPHMFIKELFLYVDYWLELIQGAKEQLDHKRSRQVETFYENIMSGIAYYRNVADQITEGVVSFKDKIVHELDTAEQKLYMAYQCHLNELQEVS